MSAAAAFDEALRALQAAIHDLGARLTGADHGALVAALADVEAAGAALAAAQPSTLSSDQAQAAAETRDSLERMMQAVRLMANRTERRLNILRPGGGAVSYTRSGAAATPLGRTHTTA